MDDVIIFGANQDEHDTRLTATLRRLQEAGVILNSQKCEFRKHTMKFLKHIVSGDDITADPKKMPAILEMPPPSCVTELSRFMGVVH